MEREVDQINVIPLVDIMLVLLVIVVTVTAEGTVFVDDRAIDEEQLEIVLAPNPRHSPVLVRADKVTRLERFVVIVDRIRGLGFQQVGLEVLRG